MMKMDIDKLLVNALAPEEEVPEEINRQILRKFRKAESVKKSKEGRRQPVMSRMAAAICILVLVCSVTGAAAIKYFTPSKVASEMLNVTLAKAFESDDAVFVNETQTFDEYTVTLLGLVSGEEFTNTWYKHTKIVESTEIAKGRTYCVIAIERTDGEPLTVDDIFKNETYFYVSPYIKGENPALINAGTLNGRSRSIVTDGIWYMIEESDNLELFAERGVYLGVSSSMFYKEDAYIWNEEDGTMIPNSEYKGVNALFEIPLDPKKADPDAAAEYLERTRSEQF